MIEYYIFNVILLCGLWSTIDTLRRKLDWNKFHYNTLQAVICSIPITATNMDIIGYGGLLGGLAVSLLLTMIIWDFLNPEPNSTENEKKIVR